MTARPLPVAYGLVSRISTPSGRVAWSVTHHSEPAAMGLTPHGPAGGRRAGRRAGPARGYLIQFNAATGAIVRGSRSAVTRSRSRSGRAAGTYALCSPTWVKGISSVASWLQVVPVTVATGKVASRC